MASPITVLIAAVAIFSERRALVVNGSAAARTVPIPMIQPKKANGCGVDVRDSSRAVG